MRSVPGWAFAWVVVGIVLVGALTVVGVGLPSDDLGLRRFQTPEIATTATPSQTFTMTADGFYAIELFPTSTGGAVSGDVRLELYDGPAALLVRRAAVRAVDFVTTPTYRFGFASIPDSQGKRYRLDVLASEVNPPKGVALLATKGVRYADGTMLLNGRERWADLAFRTFAPAEQSAWTRLMAMPAGESGLSRGHAILAVLVAYWIALGVVLRMLWRLSAAH